MALSKRKEEPDELNELRQRLEELRLMGVRADKLEEFSHHIFRVVNDLRIRAESIIETVREPLIILNKELIVITANPAFYRLFNLKEADVEGKILYIVNNKQWDIPSLRVLLERILPQNTQFNDYEIEHEFKTGKRLLLLNARVIHQREGRQDLILLAMEDITEKRKAEDEKLINELQSMLDKVSRLVPTCDNCKRVRDDKGNWLHIDEYINKYPEAYSHGLCPDCDKKLHNP
jgi:PAS domain S-box-containing protein